MMKAARLFSPYSLSVNIPTPHNNIFISLFGSDINNCRDLMRSALPDHVLGLLDLSRLSFTQDTFIDQNLRGSYSDLLLTTRLVSGERALIYLLVEHKSHPDRWTLLQLLRYMLGIWSREIAVRKVLARRGRRKTAHHSAHRGTDADKAHYHAEAPSLPVIIPLIFYHGAQEWRHPTSFGDYFPSCPEQLLRYVLNLRRPVAFSQGSAS